MGYQRPDLVLTFADDTEFAGLELRMNRLSIDDLLELTQLRAAGVNTDEEGLKAMARVAELIGPGIIRWNFEDGNGQPVVPTAEFLRAQDVAFVMAVAMAWMHAASGVTPPLPQPSTDGDQSLEASMPMDIASPSPENSDEPSSSTDSSSDTPPTP